MPRPGARLHLVLAVLLLAGQAHGGGRVAVGFLHREARQYRAEWRDYRYRRELVKHGMDGSLVENRALFHGTLNEAAFLASLRPFNAIVIPTTEEGVHQFAAVQANCTAARRALETYVREGGGLFVLLQAHRYPNSDDET